MKKSLFLVLLVVQISNAQNSRIDSLNKKLKTINSSEINFELAAEYFDIDNKRALEYVRKANSVAWVKKDSLNVAKSLRLFGQLHRRLNNLDSSFFYFLLGLPLAQRLQSYEETYLILNGIAITLSFQAKYDESLNYHLKALDMAYSKKDSTRIDRSLFNLGFVYYKLLDYKMALRYYDKSLQIKTSINESLDLDPLLDPLIVNISLCYAYLGNIEEATNRLKPLLEKCLTGCNENLVVSLPFASGVIHYKSDSLTKAELEFLHSYTAAKSRSDHRFVFDNIIFLSKIYIKEGNLKSAEKFLLEGDQMTKSNHFDLEKIKLFEEISALYKIKGDYRKLVRYQEKYIQLKDSVFNEKHTNNLMALHAEATETENKARLTSQEKTMILKDQIIERQKGINVLIGLVVLLMAALIYFLIRILQDRKLINLRLDQKVKDRTEELKRNHDELLLAIKQRDILVAKLSHDLNTSLESMQMLCSSGSKTETNSNALRYFEEINSTTLSLSNSLNNILAESRITSSVTG